jgi:hypothetical protein
MDGVERAMKAVEEGPEVPGEVRHAQVAAMYNWTNVTNRTTLVYHTVSREPILSLGDHLRRSTFNFLIYNIHFYI